MSVKIWNRMQNTADLGIFCQCEEYACMLYEIWLRAYFFTKCEILVWNMWRIGANVSRAVRNWYKFFTMLILQSEKFAVQQCSPQICPWSDCIDSWSLPSTLLVNLYKLKYHKILTMICPAAEEFLNQHCYLTINCECLWKNLEKKIV